MRKLAGIITVVFALVFSSCAKDEEYETYTLASPEYLSYAELRASIRIIDPLPIVESGKIYYKDHIIYVNDVEKGIHIIDNSDINNPVSKAFIAIIGNRDMAVKGNLLYADSYSDLVVFDVSDINAIKEVNRLEDVIPYYPIFPFEEGLEFDYMVQQPANTLLAGYTITEERRKIEDRPMYKDFALENTAVGANDSGQGGSMARFKIVKDYLYIVDSHSINVFDIESSATATKVKSVSAGFDIETIFNRGDYLFLGSMSGMYIYNINDAATPIYVSEFQHGTACDPVVVDDNYAYVTLRGGNSCGAFDSSLQIVDIRDITAPKLAKSYAMDHPYGLGVKDNFVFVCDGDSGLKAFDKTDVLDLRSLSVSESTTAYDVIPLEDRLIMIGEGKVSQYYYTTDGLDLVSTFLIK